jgi:flagellar protein FlaH
VGGIPTSSMNILEGENDTGKSILAQDIAWGALQSNFTVRYITSEMTAPALVSQMESLSWNVKPHYIRGDFRITALHVKGLNWDEGLARYFLTVISNFIRNKGTADVIVFDSLTYFATKSSPEDLLNFLSQLRNYVDERKSTVIVTVHPFAFEGNQLIRIRSICDGHIMLKIKTLPSNEIVRSLEILKLRGATKASDNTATFKVVPNMGIRVLPFTAVKA